MFRSCNGRGIGPAGNGTLYVNDEFGGPSRASSPPLDRFLSECPHETEPPNTTTRRPGSHPVSAPCAVEAGRDAWNVRRE